MLTRDLGELSIWRALRSRDTITCLGEIEKLPHETQWDEVLHQGSARHPRRGDIEWERSLREHVPWKRTKRKTDMKSASNGFACRWYSRFADLGRI